MRSPKMGAARVSGSPNAAAKEEVELKLLVPANQMHQLRTAPDITRHARGRGITRLHKHSAEGGDTRAKPVGARR